MSLMEDVRAPSRQDGICIRIDYTDNGWPKSPIEFFVNRAKWTGLSDDQRQSLAEELMTKYWGHVAGHQIRAEDA